MATDPFLLATLAALVLGLGSAVSPGPLTTLVVNETLRHGTRAGILVALAPLFTDIHALIAGIWLIGHFHDVDPFLGAVSLIGAAFLVWIGIEGLRTTSYDPDATPDPGAPRRAFKKGLVTNALSPNLYLFWFTVGATQYHDSLDTGGLPAALLFIAAFYVFFIGAKALLAVLVGKSRKWVTGQRYVWTNRILAIALLVFAGTFVWDGVRLLA